MNAIRLTATIALFVIAINAIAEQQLEEITVIADRLFRDSTAVSPTSTVTASELAAINFLTAEDAVAYEPSLVIRRRYVGDPNGVLGIRGSGMFQTARSLVFADGLPLHYLLQTRWSGSPRWSLVGPDEIESAQVIYGPYSAEYSGNAMGGIVDIKTRSPQKRKFTVQGSLMVQDYNELSTKESYSGNKLFVSYEDKIGNLGIYSSYSRLDNESQPLANYSLDSAAISALDLAGVKGYLKGKDSEGSEVIFIGDSGMEISTTELYKLKMEYNLGSIQLRGTLAFEERTREESEKNNFLVDTENNYYWDAGNQNFEERFHQRNSLLIGLGISSYLGNNWSYDIYATDFEIKKDREKRTGLSTDDPAFGARNGRLTKYADTGWNTLDIKLGTEQLFGNDDLRLSVGFYQNSYKLAIEPGDTDALTGEQIRNRSASGGETGTKALFAQWGWSINKQWDAALGLRYEHWKAKNGFYGTSQARDRSDSGYSPKFSLAYNPNDELTIRYSVARALRFAITEELFLNESSTTNIVVADPSLKPEIGIHQNLSLEHLIDGGIIKVNLFSEVVDDTIYNQRGTINDGGTNVQVTTFLAIDEVQTKGIEFIYNQKTPFTLPINIRFNTTYTDATITKNLANKAIEGNDMPRIAKWRANLILTYPATDSLDLSTSFRYASDSFGELDNGDRTNKVYGAIDRYFFVNLKANWKINKTTSASFGIDNVFDNKAYVAHPWPSRTAYLEGKLSF